MFILKKVETGKIKLGQLWKLRNTCLGHCRCIERMKKLMGKCTKNVLMHKCKELLQQPATD